MNVELVRVAERDRVVLANLLQFHRYDLSEFVLTWRLGSGVREVSEFFVVRKHRRRGIGRSAAHQALRRHPGTWELSFAHANQAAIRFWPTTVATIADGPVTSTDHHPPEVPIPRTRLHFRVRALPGPCPGGSGGEAV